MSEQTAQPGKSALPGPDVTDQSVDSSEDAGRLTNASTVRLTAIVVVLVLLSEVVTFQVAMISIIIPQIGRAFPAAGNNTSWTLTILGIVGGSCVALVGKLADLYGKRRMLLLNCVFFLAGSLICAMTSSWAFFLVGRGLQAISLSVTAVCYGVVRDLLPRRWVPISAGVIATGIGVSALVAPLVGGVLSDHYSWRSIFWFLVVYIGVLTPLLLLIVPESPVRVHQRFDVLGALLFAGGVTGMLIYLSEGGSWGWTNGTNLAYLVGGLVLMVGFVAWEKRFSHPMMELSLLRKFDVFALMWIAFLVFGIFSIANYMAAYMFETPPASELQQQIIAAAAAKQHVPAAELAPYLHLQGDLHYAAGFSVSKLAVHITMWSSLATMLLGPIGGLMARRIGSRIPLVASTIVSLIAFVFFWQWHATWQDQVWVGLILGVGVGLYYSSAPNLVIDSVPAKRQGISAGMMAAFGAVGSSAGTALLTSVLARHPAQLVATIPGSPPVTTPIPQVYTDSGYAQGYLLIGAIGAALALLLSLAIRGGRTPARGGAPV